MASLLLFLALSPSLLLKYTRPPFSLISRHEPQAHVPTPPVKCYQSKQLLVSYGKQPLLLRLHFLPLLNTRLPSSPLSFP